MNLYQFKHHKCQISSKYHCEYTQCEFVAVTLGEMLKHMENKHVKELLQCSYCEFKAKDHPKLKEHTILHHEESAMLTTIANQQILLCEEL